MILEILETTSFPDTYYPLAAQLEQKSLFLSAPWLDNFMQTVVKQNETVTWYGLKNNNGKPLLLMPLWQKPHAVCSPVKLTSLSNYYTTLYEPLHCISDQDQLKQAINLVTESICTSNWDIIDLYPFNPTSDIYALLIEAFKKQKKHVTPYFMYANWFLLTENQAFADYYAARPGQLKNTIKRRNNKLKQKQVEYRICTHPEDVESAIQLFQQTYNVSWKINEPYQDFIPGLAKTAANAGWLRLGLMFIDQKVAAAQIWLTLHDTAYIYKLCQDPNFDQYSPGSLLTTHLMEYAIDVDKVTKIDFLSGDDAYKKDWMSHRKERWGIQIANPKTIYGFQTTVINYLSSCLHKLRFNLQSIPTCRSPKLPST